MARYRTINTDLNRQYRNDLNWNFQQIEDDIKAQEGITTETKTELLAELSRIERESKERDDALADGNLEALLQSIETAKSNANTAAANADVKAAHAKTQGDYAKQQGDYAKTQGDYAGMKGDYADEKAIEADQAAGNANQEASNLSVLKVAVTDATQAANTSAGKANTAATNADGKAAYAQAQGDYAKLQGDRAKDVVETAPVVSVNGKKGVVTLTATDVGAETPSGAQAKANTAETNAKNASVPKSEKGVANGVAKLNAAGKVIDASGNEVEGKVTSVNGQVGDIVIPVFSGNYNDLSNKPALKTVATSGSYNDLTNKPTIPAPITLNNTLTSTSTTQAATANAVKQVNDKVLDTGWINLAAGSGWDSTTSPNHLQYRKIGSVVHVRGSVVPSSSGYAFTIGSLPAGFRPRTTTPAIYNEGTNAVYSMIVLGSGSLMILPPQYTPNLAGKTIQFEFSFVEGG